MLRKASEDVSFPSQAQVVHLPRCLGFTHVCCCGCCSRRPRGSVAKHTFVFGACAMMASLHSFASPVPSCCGGEQFAVAASTLGWTTAALEC
jgi:hypothetical protein